ncbi:MAG: sulfotransferase, partial [Planctomycetales bacterium]|nr:sulfotransferase [Planctomycetales bacterium]
MSAVADSPDRSASGAPLPGRDYPWYSPRFWHGMCLTDWLKLAGENRWKIHPARYGMAATTSMFSVFNSCMRATQNVLFQRAVERTVVSQPPVFILGHWRSGTTYLHELLMRDQRFATPTSYQCFQPHHFLISQAVITRLFWWIVPGKRPQDNVALDWNSPQEDEFALCALGLPTPYRRMAFPDNGPVDLDYLDMAGLSPDELARWKQGLDWFVKLLTYHTGRQVLLKSPPHTGRVATLAAMFPGAKFIHITRDPYALYP